MGFYQFRRKSTYEKMTITFSLTKKGGGPVPARCRPYRRMTTIALRADSSVSQQRAPDAEEPPHDVDRGLDVERGVEGGVPPLVAVVQLLAREAQPPAERCPVPSPADASSADAVVAAVVVVVVVVVVFVVGGFFRSSRIVAIVAPAGGRRGFYVEDEAIAQGGRVFPPECGNVLKEAWKIIFVVGHRCFVSLW